MIERISCYDCRFFSPGAYGCANHQTAQKLGAFREWGEGICRRHTPRPGDRIKRADADERVCFAEWPQVMTDDWCGEFEPRNGHHCPDGCKCKPSCSPKIKDLCKNSGRRTTNVEKNHQKDFLLRMLCICGSFRHNKRGDADGNNRGKTKSLFCAAQNSRGGNDGRRRSRLTPSRFACVRRSGGRWSPTAGASAYRVPAPTWCVVAAVGRIVPTDTASGDKTKMYVPNPPHKPHKLGDFV